MMVVSAIISTFLSACTVSSSKQEDAGLVDTLNNIYNHDYEKSIEAKRSQLETLKNQQDVEKQKLSQTQKEHQLLQEKTEILIPKIDNLDNKKQQLKKSTTVVEQQLNLTSKEKQRLHQEIAKLDKQEQHLTSSNNKQKTSIDTLIKQRDQLRKELEELLR
ncbi:hypothetical protein RCF98_04280 [Thiothrix lacustris]|uniref:Lipoprotein n=1 Tax=Thiothrix lacustris TaxID=525917 RepID=A0ABY9MTS2_9GAMM|nr:hypothetical protein [Thiothrix lacustris]WML91566.1 hypothetical protein RCF98_04280 [Thiothrix lacustris]